MARTTYITIPPELEEAYNKVLNPGDRYTAPRMNRKVEVFSARRKKGITQRSLLPEVAAAWNALSDAIRADWATAAANSGMKGWNLFVQDKCYRIINGLPGNATPSILHQGLVGQLHIEAPATELKIYQPHPYTYYILKKVTGKKAMYQPVAVEEKLYLPITLELSHKSNLEAVGEGAFAKFYADIRYLYQGLNKSQIVEINIPLIGDWSRSSIEFSAPGWRVTSYALYFHLYNVRGDVWFDNPKSLHSGTNWIRDPRCNDINAVFTKTFYQIPKHWAAITLPEGAAYESTYPDA